MNTSSICSAAAFSTPDVFGTQILSLTANLVTNFSLSVPDLYWYNHPSTVVSGANFCNVTVTYTHPGQNDTIHVTTWLPTSGAWNERIQATGGGGFSAGGENFVISHYAMAGAVGTGYAAITTDAGLDEAGDASSWALASPGNLNLGCSQGGRQGLMLAQRYPSLYDGIASSAPAVKLNSLIASCDGKDGVVDGLISDISACEYDPFTSVGNTFTCAATGTKMQISRLAATIANATWTGPVTVKGDFTWYPPNIGADISGTVTNQGTAQTSCTANGTCTGVPNSLGPQWIKLFLAKNPEFDLGNITHKQFDDLIHQGEQQFGSLIDTFDPDLSAFKAAGGKMLGYHGLADQIIPTKGTEDYYGRVMALDPHVHDFYRMFEAPGIQHCAQGSGGQPTSTFDALVAWVENGTVPETLPVSSTSNGTVFERILCPMPAKAVYDGSGDPTSAGSFSCV
ncbi:feruloyl esterase protein [Rutstroemia sp. NJR-2017a BBW]|nr:feruloyl esterase protein [Rutstroemia sp. NJR-2017a BBW]